jgi:hypothetical protein
MPNSNKESDMHLLELTRRQLLIIGTGGTFVESGFPTTAGAQGTEVPTFRLDLVPRKAGAFHNQQLDETAGSLDGLPLNSKEGLFRMVDLLVKLGLLTESDGQLLKALISTIFDERSDVNEIAKNLRKLYDDAAEKAGELAVAVCSIAHESIEYAKKLDPKRTIFIVAADVSGALNGAAALGKLGPPILAVLGALAGAIAASGAAAYGSRPGTGQLRTAPRENAD